MEAHRTSPDYLINVEQRGVRAADLIAVFGQLHLIICSPELHITYVQLYLHVPAPTLTLIDMNMPRPGMG